MATRPITVSLDFINYGVSSKISLGATVAPNITANAAIFVTPDVAPAALTAATNDLETKNNAYISAGGGKKAIAELAASEKTWNGLFRVTARYVSRIADGHSEIIALTGFPATSGEAVPAVVPDKTVPSLIATSGATSLKVINKIVPGAKGFLTLLLGLSADVSYEQKGRQIDIFKDGQYILSISVNTQGKTSFEGIDTGKNVRVACMAFNRAGIGAAGESNTVTVL